jgi:hypothetical protein
MRSLIRQKLLTLFTSALERALPEFKRCGEECATGGTDYSVWALRLSTNLTFFVMLQPFDKEDQFTVEVGWSDDDKFPWKESGLRFFKIENPKSRRRLARLWFTGQTEPVWEIVRGRTFEETRARIKAMSRGDREEVKRIDKLTDVSVEEAIPRVAPLVEDAVQKLIDFGLPLFRRVAEHRGLTWPTRDELPSQAVTSHVPGVR